MGACAGKSNRPAVVVIKTKNKPSKQTNPENNTAFDEYDEPQISQINQSDPQQKPQSPHPPQQDLHPEVQDNPPEERPVQKSPEKIFVSPAHHEEKHVKDHALDDADVKFKGLKGALILNRKRNLRINSIRKRVLRCIIKGIIMNKVEGL